MTSVAEGLFKTESAAAPTIDFIKRFRVLNGDWPSNGRNGLQSLLVTFSCVLFFDLSLKFEVEVGLILILKGDGCVLRFDDPGFRRDVFDFFEEVAASA